LVFNIFSGSFRRDPASAMSDQPSRLPASGAPLAVPGAPPVILASGSTTRSALLRAAGVQHEVLVPGVDETSLIESLLAEGVRAEDGATALAEVKARQVAARLPPDCIVLGCDQLLDVDGSWYEKPPDRAAARAQLLRLRGKQHRLVSAVVAYRGQARVWHTVDVAVLTVRPFSQAWLDGYLGAVDEAILGSAGAYQIEGLGAQLMSEITGSHFTVLGLPLLPLLQFLRDQGVLLT
jgi:septum formation protein